MARRNAVSRTCGWRAHGSLLVLVMGLTAGVVQNAAAQSPSLVLSPTSLDVPEAGSASYTVKLATLPTADVTVSIGGTSGTDLSLNRTSLTFTMSNCQHGLRRALRLVALD